MLTREQIQNHENPYQLLTADNNLLEHCRLLHTLEQPAMKGLALKIVNQCDWNSIEDLIGTITKVQEQDKVKNNFLDILNHIILIKCHFAEVLFSTNNQYSPVFANAELCEKTFQGYQDASISIIQGKEEELAKNLAKSTPLAERSQLIRNITNLFPKSALVTKISEVFPLARNIERFLLGKNPALFFINGDFSSQMCTEYRDLFTHFLKCDNDMVEATIGSLLAADTESNPAQREKAEQVLTKLKDDNFGNNTVYGSGLYRLFKQNDEGAIDNTPQPTNQYTI